MKYYHYVLLLLITLFLTNRSQAQVTADFTADQTKGCSPLFVTFTNASNVQDNTVTWEWKLDNVVFSTERNPSKTIDQTGYHTITLKATKGGASTTKSINVRVYKGPTANFSLPKTKTCIPLDATFINSSTEGDTTMSTYLWYLAPGVTDLRPTPSYIYNTEGKYNVSLKITDNHGCTDTKEVDNYVDVANKPVASFDYDPQSSCKVPVTVNFTNTSTVTGNASYTWTAAQNMIQYTKDASFTLTSYDTQYQITLTVKDNDYGCTSDPSILDYPIIRTTKAIGSLKKGSTVLKNGDIICPDNVDFASNSLPVGYPIHWEFEDDPSASTYSATGSHFYGTAGTYTTRLIAGYGGECADTLKWTFTVDKPVPNFSEDKSSSCEPSSTVKFTNLSTNAISYKWQFADGSISFLTNPSIVYSVDPNADPYETHTPTIFTTILTAISPNGCSDSYTGTFTIQRPTALFSVDTASGCAPLKVNFTSNSMSEATINKLDWDFGDGNQSHQTTSSTESHIYNTPGIYKAKLTISNTDLCSDESYFITIKVGSVPHPDFSVTLTTVCQGDPITIQDLTPAADKADYWQYYINGIGIPVCSTVASPTFKFKPATGQLSITQVVGYNGCYASITKENIITNNGPIASFAYKIPDCSSPFNYQFSDSSKGAVTLSWNFGDGVSSLSSPAHTFAGANDYKVQLIATAGSCRDTATQIVPVRDRSAMYTADLFSVCADDTVKFNSTGSQPLSTHCGDKYDWNFEDGTEVRTDVDDIKHAFKKKGAYDVQMVAIHDNGCSDTIRHTVTVHKPQAGLEVNKSQGCPPLTNVIFSDKSVPDGTTPIVSWTMDYGDDPTKKETSSTSKSFGPHTYFLQDVFPATLTIKDGMGCVDQATIKIEVAQPEITVGDVDAVVCANSPVSFSQNSVDVDDVVWDFGDGSVIHSNTGTLTYKYVKEGTFTPTVTVYKFGCTAVGYLPGATVTVQKVDASFTVADSVFKCPHDTIRFTHKYPSEEITGGEWSTGDNQKIGYNYLEPSKVFEYKSAGSFTAKLIVTTGACSDTVSKTIKIGGPMGKVTVTPKDACKGDLITYSLQDTSGISKFIWDFGDGNKETSNINTTHRYSIVGKSDIYAILYGFDPDCTSDIHDSVHIKEVVAKFSVPDTAACTERTVLFTNESLNNTSQKWDFRDGSAITTEVSPEHTFTAGTYLVALMVDNSALGCRDTARKTIVVNATPHGTASYDRTLCAQNKIQLHATGGNYVRWYPKAGLSDSTLYDPVVTPDSSVWYKAKVINSVGGCFSLDSVQILHPRAVIFPKNDTALVIGDTLRIIVSDTSFIKSFRWDPASDLSCTACLNPLASPTASISYYFIMTDPMGCTTDTLRAGIALDNKGIGFNAPTAFQPGSEGLNSIFMIRGKGIREVLEFKIYNRWGNVVFTTTDKNQGWDGKYQGKDQPIDTYVWSVTVRLYDGQIQRKKGTFMLLR